MNVRVRSLPLLVVVVAGLAAPAPAGAASPQAPEVVVDTDPESGFSYAYRKIRVGSEERLDAFSIPTSRGFLRGALAHVEGRLQTVDLAFTGSGEHVLMTLDPASTPEKPILTLDYLSAGQMTIGYESASESTVLLEDAVPDCGAFAASPIYAAILEVGNRMEEGFPDGTILDIPEQESAIATFISLAGSGPRLVAACQSADPLTGRCWADRLGTVATCGAAVSNLGANIFANIGCAAAIIKCNSDCCSGCGYSRDGDCTSNQ